MAKGGRGGQRASSNKVKHDFQKKRTTFNNANEKKTYKKAFNSFNNNLFDGLNHNIISNKYVTMDRISQDKNKICVNVSDSHLKKTKYGQALILDNTHVVFIKDWQVNRNYRNNYTNEVILDRKYFNVKTWGQHTDFTSSKDLMTFDKWVNVAKKQKNNKVEWEL